MLKKQKGKDKSSKTKNLSRKQVKAQKKKKHLKHKGEEIELKEAHGINEPTKVEIQEKKKKKRKFYKKKKSVHKKDKPTQEKVEKQEKKKKRRKFYKKKKKDKKQLKAPKTQEERILELRQEVQVVEDYTKKGIEKLLQRQEKVEDLQVRAVNLEENAECFKETTGEVKLKFRCKNRCCGLFACWRCCWYIGACQWPKKKAKVKDPTVVEAEKRKVSLKDETAFNTSLQQNDNTSVAVA